MQTCKNAQMSSAHVTHPCVAIPCSPYFCCVPHAGLWDVFSSQEAVNFVRRRLHAALVARAEEHAAQAAGALLRRVAGELVAKAVAMGSVDNTSACIIAFNV